MILGKNMKKQILKVLRNLKAMKNELIASSSNNDNNRFAVSHQSPEHEVIAINELIERKKRIIMISLRLQRFRGVKNYPIPKKKL